MPVIAERGFFFNLFHHGSGYSSGPVETIDHNIAGAEFSIHVGLSRVQATRSGPFGAAIGIMSVGGEDFGTDPANWRPLVYTHANTWTVAAQVVKGDMTAWEFFQVWA